MQEIDPGTLRNLLNIGVVVFLAALLGGGLDASGLLRIPVMKSVRVQLAVGTFGAVLIAGSLAALTEYQSSNTWDQDFNDLRRGAAGLPPPKFPPQLISDDLEQLTLDAGSDFWRNCEIAAFVKDHAVRLPVLVVVKIRNAASSSSGAMICYRQLLKEAQDDATNGSSTKTSNVSLEASMPSFVIASNDLRLIASQLRTRRIDAVQVVAQATEVALPTPATNILEAAAAVGLRGWMFLGTSINGSLGDDRTVADLTVPIGATVVTRRPVNLHEVGYNSDYRRHRVEAIIPPGAHIEVENVTPQTSSYRWAQVRIVSLPSTY